MIKWFLSMKKAGITINGIYQHCLTDGHNYRVIDVHPNATGYEKTGNVAGSIVIYQQLFDGTYPSGTIWTREIADFKDTTEINGKIIPIFTFIEESPMEKE